jgi:kynurenine formamidase
MNIIDLSYTISENMPVYPGTEPPKFEVPVSLEKEGFLEKKITFFSHTGTHIDAPAHILPGARTLDQLEVTNFTGSGFVIDLSACAGQVIETEILQPFEDYLKNIDFALLYSGWGRYWGEKKYFQNYPVLSKGAAEWLCRFDLKGIGIDMISVDRTGSKKLPIHHILLNNNLIIIENLNNLHRLVNKNLTLFALPLKIDHADGAPARVIALH